MPHDVIVTAVRERPPTAIKVSLADFLAREFPPRQNLLAPWLPEQGLCMVYAPRGVGKTYFALSVAYAVAAGGRFLNWYAPEPQGVLYLDGEMPATVMQERLAAIVRGADQEPAAPFELVTPDLQERGIPRLDCAAGQAAIEEVMSPETKLIICDNLSTLTSGAENDGDDWLPVQSWALSQRAQGRSVLMVHHAGKGGQQRGTSRREDVLDTVLALKHPPGYTPDQGASFEIHFEKGRGIYGDNTLPIEATLTESTEGALTWASRTLEASTLDKVVKLTREGLNQPEIADALGINKSTVSRHLKKARSMGLLSAQEVLP